MNYITEVKKLCSTNYDISKVDPDIVHGIIGCVTESGEMMDALKKATFYGKEFDLVNLKEEMGDLMWYLALLCYATNTDFKDIQAMNLQKLHARYEKKKFDEDDCEHRDLEKERSILEDSK